MSSATGRSYGSLFFLTFVPQFLPDSGPTLPVALALSAIFATLYVAWFSGLVTLVGLASDALLAARAAGDRGGRGADRER
jgi:threonine/homoserine/homoserine lactone efflux protein